MIIRKMGNGTRSVQGFLKCKRESQLGVVLNYSTNNNIMVKISSVLTRRLA